MSLLTDVGTYLNDASISTADLTLGTNLFLSTLPDSPDTCVAVIQGGGVEPEDTFGTSHPILEQPSIQTLVRASSYATAESLAVDIFKSLTSVENQTLTSTLYQKITAQQSPFPIEEDERERIIMSCNFSVIKNI